MATAKYQSTEEIRQALGLAQKEEIIKQTQLHGVYPRRSGRTTELVLKALLECQTKKVFIVSMNMQCSRHAVQVCRHNCTRLGLDPMQVNVCVSSGEDKVLRGYGDARVVLYDHTYIEGVLGWRSEFCRLEDKLI